MMMKVKIMGGLGNQMFQYAHGRKLELSGKKIIFDVSFFNGNRAKGDTSRDFKLDVFNIETGVEFLNKSASFFVFIDKVKRRLGLKIEEHYQGEKYFTGISDVIRKELALKNSLSDAAKGVEKKILGCNSISLHVRRGDYVADSKTNAFHGVCSLDYYRVAINLIRDRLSAPIFFVFSDDIVWAKENFVDEKFVFVSNSEIKDHEEMMLMSKCRHNIIANSSFSWWGAWLNNNPDKIVIAPEKWFVDEGANANNDIIPSEWIRV